MRTLLLGLFLLTVGFCFGWFGRPLVPSSATVSPRAAATAGSAETPVPISAGVTDPRAGADRPAPPTSKLKSESERLQAVRLLKRAGLPIDQHYFGEKLSPTLIAVLELSAAEVTTLETFNLETKNAIEAARAARADARPSADGKTLWIEVPPLNTAQSAGFFDRLQQTYANVLGAERYQLLNEIHGAGIERAFDHYGLSPVRYELNLQPKSVLPGRGPLFEFKRHIVDATGASSSWTGSTLTYDDITRSHPTIARFFKIGPAPNAR
jgi:hypothetical protein